MQHDQKQVLLDIIYRDKNFTLHGGVNGKNICDALDLCLKTQDLDNFHKIILMRVYDNFIREVLLLAKEYPLVLLQIMEDWNPNSQFMAKNKKYKKFPSGLFEGDGGDRIFRVAISALVQAKDDEEKSLRLKVVMGLIDYMKATFGYNAAYDKLRRWQWIVKQEKNAINESDFDDIVDSVNPPKPEKHWEPEPNQEELDL